MRSSFRLAVALAALVAGFVPGRAEAQGFGIGGRFSFIKPDVDAEVDSERFMGGQVRLGLSRRTAIELSLDVRTETNEAATLRVREYPIQASFLLYPVRSVLSPYVLGGGGWYAQRIETLLDDEVQASETTRDFGWHAGFGGELQLGRHLGIHADYRYTFLDFGDDDEPGGEPAGANGFSRLVSFLPSHKGSMWTAGLTVYF